MAIPWKGEQSIDMLIQHTFPCIGLKRTNSFIFENGAILAPINVEVDWLNDKITQFYS